MTRMSAQDFHKGDRVKVPWGQMGLVEEEPGPRALLVGVTLKKSIGPASVSFFRPSELKLVRRGRG